jgi:Flp pilus assembly protein TadG
MNKRGSITIFMGATIPIALVAGLYAVNFARIWVAQARLQSAVDAAALTGARNMGNTAAEIAQRDANVRAVLNANWNDGAPPPPGQTSDQWKDVTITTINGNQLEVGAATDVKAVTVSIGGVTIGGGTTTITAKGRAESTSSGLELALVFDTTLSMAEQVNGKAHIQYAAEAATKLLETLYGDQFDSAGKLVGTRKEYLEHLYVSIVPFNIAVNIGTANAHMLDSNANTPKYSDGFSWTGCVEARQGTFHLTDHGPVTAGFQRFYWPSTYNPALNNSNGSCTAGQSYLGSSQNPEASRVCMGSNDWTAPSSVVAQNNFLVDANKYVVDTLDGVNKTLSFSPNMMCPTTPILPLTRRRATIESYLVTNGQQTAKITDLPFAFGTMIPAGLQGGWYTLSQYFRSGTATGGAGWTRVEPAPAASEPALPALPLDYKTANMQKVMVLLSDGDNNWPNARNITQAVRGTSSTYGSSSKVVLPDSTRTELFYSAYGFLSTENRLDISIPNNGRPRSLNSSQLVSDYSSVRNASDGADARLDAATRTLCTNIKANNQILLIVVGYGVEAEAHRQLLKDCATSSAYYFETTDPTQCPFWKGDPAGLTD